MVRISSQVPQTISHQIIDPEATITGKATGRGALSRAEAAAALCALDTRRRERFGDKGFTLIEVLIVLAIIVVIMTVAMPAISRITYQRVDSTTRHFVGVVHTIRNDAILLNGIYRLTIDIEHKTWYVERQKQFKLLADAGQEPQSALKVKNTDQDTASNFEPDEHFGKKPQELPSGVAFDGVLKEREGLITRGVAYIYFFPSGFNERAILYINKEGATSGGNSIVISPVAGRVEIFKRHVNSFAELNEGSPSS